MTRVDFYILPEGAKPPEGAVMTACKLCDKAAGAGNRIYLYAPDPAVADSVDGLLWSFRQGSFVSHERLSQALEEPLPMVLIGSAEPPEQCHDVMINLGAEVPPFFSRFERVLEIVDGDAAQRAKSRERFKFYRERGYELATHNL
ncbi:MAG: DNA polymerase III subunit chi [Nevskia sp.]|nr:DNA polymerase III subunit chi [Nevskia sp.]